MGLVKGRSLVKGQASGVLLHLSQPISFWGGVDPVTGGIVDPRHPQFGQRLGGRILAIPAAIGSSSSSAIMLELLREGVAPAAILMGSADAILALGAVVAEELGYPSIPIVELGLEQLAGLPEGAEVRVDEDGSVLEVDDSPLSSSDVLRFP